MPFADYKTFAQCVNENQDKKDPQAYCGAIQAQIERGRKKKRKKR